MAFLLPYLIVFVPLVVMKFDAGWVVITLQIAAILVMVVAAQMATAGFCFSDIGYVERGALAAASLLCGLFLFGGYLIISGLGLAVFAAVLIWQFMTNRKQELATVSG